MWVAVLQGTSLIHDSQSIGPNPYGCVSRNVLMNSKLA
jgi:hypothetical protein